MFRVPDFGVILPFCLFDCGSGSENVLLQLKSALLLIISFGVLCDVSNILSEVCESWSCDS